MKRFSLVSALILLLALLVASWWTGALKRPGSLPEPQATPSAHHGLCPDGAEPLHWKAPMDPTYVRDTPGQSPMGMDLVPECPPASGATASSTESRSVSIDPAMVQTIGVRTAPVVRTDLARLVRAVGRVDYDERRVSHVHTKVQGWVESLFVDFVGQSVVRGEPLLEIYSPELVATQEELLLALEYREATGQSPLEDVRSGGRSLFDATRRRLALWDIREQDVDRLLETGEVQRTLTLHAPSSGVITRLGVRTGMEVTPNTNLYTLADLSHVWVIANVYEYELPWLEVGQKASIEFTALPGKTFTGALSYIAPFLDPATRTAELRLELENSNGELKPQMFGNVKIASTPRPGVLTIPTEAVIRSGERSMAVVALGEGRFEPREIQLGLDSGDGRHEIVSGLFEGESIVVSSQFLIDSESNLREVVRKLLSERRPSGSVPRDDPSDHDHAPPRHHEHESHHHTPVAGE